MNTAASAHLDLQAARSDILNQKKTAHVIHRFLHPESLQTYFSELRSIFESAPRVKDKPTQYNGADCVQPWIYDHQRKAFMVHRTYLFPHNERGSARGAVHHSIMQARDDLEAPWSNQEAYREHRYRSFHILTKYEDGVDGYPRHSDVPYDHPTPMLQCWLQLSQPGVDYSGGDLILYPPAGGQLSLAKDLRVQAGDLVFFDKRTEHEVTPCKPIACGLGRWIIIVGAMGAFESP